MNRESKISEQDLASLLAEIEQLPTTDKGKAFNFTPDMDKCLLTMRDRGVPWANLLRWWHSKGWPGGDSTLRRRVNYLRAGDQP